jgi:hypothetical protein
VSEREPSEAELREALEAELKRVTVDDLLLQSVVSLINLSGRRLGLAPGAEGERDLDQVERGIEAVRAQMPLLERGTHAAELGPLRDALAQLQMAYAKAKAQPGASPEAESGAEAPAQPAEGEDERPGPAQSSGRLWVPGS